MAFDPYDTSVPSTPIQLQFHFTCPLLIIRATTPASTMGDSLPDLTLSSSPMPETPITSWRKQMYSTSTSGLMTPPRLRFRSTSAIATPLPSLPPSRCWNSSGFGTTSILSTVEVAQVSEQLALLPSDVGSASGSAVQADDVVVPAVRKTKCIRQQMTRLAQADSIGGCSQKRRRKAM
ncbi:hypothetical protein DEU56DRAFT_915962 [Suillus clintonianus]|uniref:uncharacterized protein n=1 Tax=Suillus clintonianus TaxID=1904413 RepID=UPI001B86AC6F|nr:uncharacterized protein DEU56DRAFT_915962 [Suillus clintonianus]KAG2126849.1 hypothetical protein DEU56DRAFT_915962 [Suillus clintonianus]